MALAFLSVKTSDDGGKERIVAITALPLEGSRHPHFLTTWHPLARDERAILADFCRTYSFWNHRWDLTPVCLRAEKVLGPLWRRSMAHGLLDFGKDPWDAKPTLDLHPLLCILNADAEPGDSESHVPPMFYGASLAKFTGTMQGADSVGAMVRAGMHKAADAALAAEADALLRLWDTLKAEAPAWWRTTLAPKLAASK